MRGYIPLLLMGLIAPLGAQAPTGKALAAATLPPPAPPAAAPVVPVEDLMSAYLGWWRAASLRQQEALARLQATPEYGAFDAAQKARSALEADLTAKLKKLGKTAPWQTGEIK